MASAVALGLLIAPLAMANPVNFVQNGNFTNTTATTANGTGTEISNTNLSGWSVSACIEYCGSNSNNLFMFLVPATAANSGVYDGNDGGPINFWSEPGAAPGGGNAITSDADNQVGVLLTTVSGLNPGDTYTLSFEQASMQADDESNPFTAQWGVQLGNSFQLGTVMSNPGGTNTGWVTDSLNFTATAATEGLGFVATAGQAGDPPFLLLADVSLTDSTLVPEPGTLGVMMAGMIGIAMVRRRRARG